MNSERRLGRERGRDALLVVVALGAYPVEELAAGAEVEAEVEVVCRLLRETGRRARRESAFGIRYSAFRNQHSEFSIERSAFSISALSVRHSALRARTVRVDARAQQDKHKNKTEKKDKDADADAPRSSRAG